MVAEGNQLEQDILILFGINSLWLSWRKLHIYCALMGPPYTNCVKFPALTCLQLAGIHSMYAPL